MISMKYLNSKFIYCIASCGIASLAVLLCCAFRSEFAIRFSRMHWFFVHCMRKVFFCAIISFAFLVDVNDMWTVAFTRTDSVQPTRAKRAVELRNGESNVATISIYRLDETTETIPMCTLHSALTIHDSAAPVLFPFSFLCHCMRFFFGWTTEQRQMTYSFLPHTCCEQHIILARSIPIFRWLDSFGIDTNLPLCWYFLISRFISFYLYFITFAFLIFAYYDFVTTQVMSSNNNNNQSACRTTNRRHHNRDWFTIACAQNANTNFSAFSSDSLNLTMSYRPSASVAHHHHRIYFNLIYLFSREQFFFFCIRFRFIILCCPRRIRHRFSCDPFSFRMPFGQQRLILRLLLLLLSFEEKKMNAHSNKRHLILVEICVACAFTK